jgi:hypothetical protein
LTKEKIGVEYRFKMSGHFFHRPTGKRPGLANEERRPPESQHLDDPAGLINIMIGVDGSSDQIPSALFQEVYGSDSALTFGLSLSRTPDRSGGLALEVAGGFRFYSKTGAAILSQDQAAFNRKKPGPF